MIRLDVFNLCASITLNPDNFNTNLDKAQKKFKSFSDNISSLSGKIDSVYKGVGDALKPAVDGFKAVEDVGKKAGNAITTGLKGFAAAATAVGGFGAAAAKSGMQFDATMSEVSAISGATGQDFQDLRDKALEMGAKTKFSASEAASAMTYMGMAGWKAGDMISGIEGIMNLAAASGEDLAATSDIVTDALTAFGLQAGDSGHFADVLAKAASSANTNVGMMGESFKYAAPLAGAMKYNVEDVSIALGLMANSGIKASQAGTSFRSAISHMLKPSDPTVAAMKQLGLWTGDTNVAFENADGSAKTLGETMGILRNAFSGLTETEQAHYAAQIFGVEAMSGMLAIINASTEDYEKLTAAIYDCNGAAEEMSATMIDNLRGDLTLLGSAFESLQIAISDSLTPTLREFAQFGQKAMAGLLEGFQGGGVSGFMSALSGIVTNGVTMLTAKAPEFASVSLQFVQALADGLLGAGNEILVAGDKIAYILIDGIGVRLSENADNLTNLGYEIVANIFGAFLSAGDIISEHIGNFVPLIVDAFTAYHEAMFTVGLDILGAIGQGLTENKDEIQHWISVTIENMVTSLRDNAPVVIEGGLALLEALVGAIEENLPLILETGVAIIGELISGISTASPGVQAIIGTAILPHILKIVDTVGKIGGAVSSVASVVGGAINGVIGIGGKLMGGISKLWALLMSNPITQVITVVGLLVAAFVALWNTSEDFRNFWIGLWENLKNVVSTAVDAIVGFFSGIVDFIKNNWQGILLMIVNPFTGAFKLIYDNCEAFRNFVDGLMKSVGDMFAAGWEAVKSAWSAASGFFSGLFSGIKNAATTAGSVIGSALSKAWVAVTSAWNGATGFFSGIWDGIKGVFSNAWDAFTDIGGNIVKGIWNGITNLAGWLRDKIMGFFSGIVNGVKSFLGIHSPSTVFAGIGGNMALGLSAGWDSEYGDIKRQIEGGLNFGTATVGLNATARYGAQDGAGRTGNGWGNTYVTINSPVSVDGVQAAREWQKTAQRMALGYV